MFAFCIYDLRTHVAYLCRDPLEKSRFYSLKNGDCVCSEARWLLFICLKGCLCGGVYDYLSYLTTPAPNSFFEVAKLEAGHYPQDVDGVIANTLRNVAEHLSNVEIEPQPLSGLASSFGKTYEEATRRIVGADVPIAVALSGGLDSSMNLYHASKFLKVN